MKNSKSLCLILATLCLPLTAVGTELPDEISIKSISYEGDGTPLGSVGTSISSDRKTFTLIFDSFVASTGAGTPLAESGKSSQINLDLNGEGRALFAESLRGYVQLPAGATATVTTVLVNPKKTEHNQVNQVEFVGPVSRDYLLETPFVLKAKGTEPEAILQVHIAIQSGNPGVNAQFTVDSLDGQIINSCETSD